MREEGESKRMGAREFGYASVPHPVYTSRRARSSASTRTICRCARVVKSTSRLVTACTCSDYLQAFVRAYIVRQQRIIPLQINHTKAGDNTDLFTYVYRSQTPDVHAEADLHLVQAFFATARVIGTVGVYIGPMLLRVYWTDAVTCILDQCCYVYIDTRNDSCEIHLDHNKTQHTR